jgi:sterol desaturase/sphingolipid hydroxylase (fatty acid hydroxylase superfamily)
MEALSQLSIEQFIGLQWANNLVRYFLIAGLTYMIFWKWSFEKLKHKFLYDEKPGPKEIRREMFFSVISTMIFLLPTLFLVSIKDLGLSKIYWKIDELGWAWYFTSYIIVFLFHDTYFYWTHRWMHRPALYKYFHKVHHLSKKPSPMAAFAFHPLEAIVEGMVFMFIAFVLPVHFSVLVLFSLFSLFMNVYGHLGFSLFSDKQLGQFPLKLFSHSTHHSWHHQYYKGNYGFYLQFWDRTMGTWKGGIKKK